MPDAHWPLLPMLPLSRIPLDVSLPEEEYRHRLKECRKKLAQLHNRLYRKKVPVVILYEGWDAAGKGGNIKRLAGALDPRWCPLPAPPRRKRTAITCGASGPGCPRPGTLPFLTEVGTAG